jgi:hypothetical protein
LSGYVETIGSLRGFSAALSAAEPRAECKDIEHFDEVGAALGEIVDPRFSKIASTRCRSRLSGAPSAR